MADEGKKLTLSEVEEFVNDFAVKYAQDHYTMPRTAFRIFLWPSDTLVKITREPTARIIMGILPHHPRFNETMRSAIDKVAVHKLYSGMAVEKLALILERDTHLNRWLKEKYNFEPELIPHMLSDEEITVRYIERVEVVHKATGMREVVETDEKQTRTTFAARHIARMRLARRVHEARLAELVKDQHDAA